MTERGPESCSFCNKTKDTVQKLIVSNQIAICNECVSLCQDLLQDPVEQDTSHEPKLDAREVKQFLDQYVIGQRDAKIVLSVAIVNHYKRLRSQPSSIEIQKSNILLLGPTGSGKTLLAKTVARYLDVPFVIADATSITEAGYVGDDVEMLISRLYAAAQYDLEKCQRGIVFIDEIDKIGRKSESTSITRDVSGEGVQQALLKLIEGTVCRVPTQPGRKHPQGESVEVDTKDILFIAGGAFVGINDIIKKRLQGSSMGFTTDYKWGEQDLDDNVMADDMIRFGMIPELVGRFGSVISLKELSNKELLSVLTTVKHNLIEQYQYLFSIDGISLVIDPAALEVIVDRAQKSGTGARGLQTQLERTLMPHMFHAQLYREMHIEEICITPELVNTPTSLQGNQWLSTVDQ